MPSQSRGSHADHYEITNVSLRPQIIIEVYEYGDFDQFYSVTEYHAS